MIEGSVNVQTLRYYERLGLLPEPPRTDSGHRDYDRESVRIDARIPGWPLDVTLTSNMTP